MTYQEVLEQATREASLIISALQVADENTKLRAMLRRLEWRGDNTCPICRCHRANDHATDCSLGELLRRENGPNQS